MYSKAESTKQINFGSVICHYSDSHLTSPLHPALKSGAMSSPQNTSAHGKDSWATATQLQETLQATVKHIELEQKRRQAELEDEITKSHDKLDRATKLLKKKDRELAKQNETLAKQNRQLAIASMFIDQLTRELKQQRELVAKKNSELEHARKSSTDRDDHGTVRENHGTNRYALLSLEEIKEALDSQERSIEAQERNIEAQGRSIEGVTAWVNILKELMLVKTREHERAMSESIHMVNELTV